MVIHHTENRIVFKEGLSMTAFDIIFLVCILVFILAGIALGFHMAYRLTEGRIRSRENDSYSVRPHSAKSTRDIADENGKQVGAFWKRKRKNTRLRNKIKNKKQISFSEFNCQFTGEDPVEKLERTRAEQDAAYNCLESRVEGP